MIQALNGSLLLDITNGAWHGIDMDSILKNGISSEKIDNSNLKTPFHHSSSIAKSRKASAIISTPNCFPTACTLSAAAITDLNYPKATSENLLIQQCTAA